jgi:hypothetical protein
MLRHDNQFFAFAIAAATLAALSLATPAIAGDGNTLYIQQSGSAGTNSLYVDQSAANNSIVAGDIETTGRALQDVPALQDAGNNTAWITLSGDGARVGLRQTDTTLSGLSIGTNTAIITGRALATILLNQDGYGNHGTITVNGSLDNRNHGELLQEGNKNKGTVTVSGSGTSGILSQTGDRNEADLEVVGNGTVVVWTQTGNDITTYDGTTPAKVFSNAGKITVTQSTLP